jgi:hypothetical protein
MDRNQPNSILGLIAAKDTTFEKEKKSINLKQPWIKFQQFSRNLGIEIRIILWIENLVASQKLKESTTLYQES